ncbi:MAG TPA: glycosyltransferase [Candidatus Kapabacteria bacterium]|jgi:glycosyltransferase involved in cell wall biosynthesis
MHDELHEQPSTDQPSDDQPANELDGNAEANVLTESSAPETADAAHEKTAPAATASSYRDIIAERLARKSGDHSTTSPMAFTSDVERKPTHAAIASSSAERTNRSALPSEIEASTAQQEISASDAASDRADANTSSRDRARARQQERAALRRQGARREPIEAKTEEASESLADSTEQTPEAKTDVIAERMRGTGRRTEARGDRQHSERATDTRPEREPRAERESRPEREPRAEREPRPEREPRAERESRPEREPEERQREARPERQRGPRPERNPQAETPQKSEMPSGIKGLELKPELRRAERPIADRPIAARSNTERPQKTLRTEPAISSAATEKTPEEARELGMKLGISVVIPLFNEQDSLRELTAALKQQLMRLAGPKYEVLFVNDGSTDHSGEILQDLLVTSSHISVISFRRNLGKSAALAAGFAEAQYGIVITMDADLQDDPREFVNLIAKLAEGYDLVSGWKKQRHDPISKTGPSKFFNRVTSLFSGIKLHDFNCGLKAYRKQVTDNLQVYGELHRYLPALAYWQGFRVTEIPVTHHPRKFGKSKFGSSRFFKGFLDLLSIVFTNRYGKRPLHLFGTVGTLMAIVGFIIDIWLTIEWALGMTSLSNRPILLLGLLLILVGVQLVSIGLLGEMIVKYGAARQLPSYTKDKGHASAEARERRANRVGGRPFRRPNK